LEILTGVNIQTDFYSSVSLETNILKKRSVVINAENVKNIMASWDTVFPFVLRGHVSYQDSICPFGC
jgi:hypothetical protein